jgi:lysophospholipase L1-like esterase
MTCTPEALADLATCFVEVSDGQRDSMLTYLVGQVSFGPQIITDLVYVLSDSDNGHALLFSNTQTQIIVVPPTLTTGFACTCERLSTGMLHVFPRSGLTVSTVNGFRVDTAGTATLSLSGVTLTVGGNITTDLVQIGGIPVGSFGNSGARDGFTEINATVSESLLQDGYIRSVSFVANATNESPTGFKWKVFRLSSGVTFDFVAETETFAVPNASVGTTYSHRFTSPVVCFGGDNVGYYASAGNRVAYVFPLGTQFVSAGDITTTTAFTGPIGASSVQAIFGGSPLCAVTGDSIIAGTSTETPVFLPPLNSGPSGRPDAQFVHLLRNSIGSGFEFQNWAQAGQQFAWVASTGVPLCIAARAAWIWVHCGINDLVNSVGWSSIESSLNTIKALLVNGERLIISELLPATITVDGQAATLRTWNGLLAAWCAANEATLFVCHDAMGVLRMSTGFLDDLNPAYNANADGVHPNNAGNAVLAALAEAQFGLT